MNEFIQSMRHKYEGKTYEEYLELIKENGNNLMYIPDEHKTKELCLEAIKNIDFCAIQFIPYKQRTYDLCFELIKHQGSLALWYIPDHIFDEFEKNGWHFSNPRKMI